MVSALNLAVQANGACPVSAGKQHYLQSVEGQGNQITANSRRTTSLRVLLPADLIAGAWQIEVSCKSSLTDFQVGHL
jgi:hypothetical protein